MEHTFLFIKRERQIHDDKAELRIKTGKDAVAILYSVHRDNLRDKELMKIRELVLWLSEKCRVASSELFGIVLYKYYFNSNRVAFYIKVR